MAHKLLRLAESFDHDLHVFRDDEVPVKFEGSTFFQLGGRTLTFVQRKKAAG